jgi:hypothetical protein
MVPEKGIEPSRGVAPADFESAASTSSATPAGRGCGADYTSRRHPREVNPWVHAPLRFPLPPAAGTDRAAPAAAAQRQPPAVPGRRNRRAA